jgi:hypothetical protein
MSVIAASFQVKEGTENRGSIESVVRVVRKTVRRIFICSCWLLTISDTAAKCQTSAATSAQLQTPHAQWVGYDRCREFCRAYHEQAGT